MLMLARYKVVVVAVFSLLTTLPGLSDPPKKRASIEDELKAIKGIWQTEQWGREKAEGYQVQVGVGERNEKMEGGVYCSLTFHVVKGAVNGKGKFTEVGVGTPVHVREDRETEKRWFEFDEAYAKVAKLPAKLYYQPDGEQMLVVLDSRPYKGEYMLRKLKAKID